MSADELAAVLPDACVLDASWIYPPFNSAKVDVLQRYIEAHIPGSWFLDLAALSRARPPADARVEVLTRPPGALVRELVAKAASLNSLIVVTDMDGGCTSAPFARYLLMEAGYRNVRLLDGGTPSWAHEHGLALISIEPRFMGLSAHGSDIITVANRRMSTQFAAFEDVTRAIGNSSEVQLIDCRAHPDNVGVLPDDYLGVEIPCECVVRSSEVVEETAFGQRFNRSHKLVALFAARAIDPRRSQIATCYFGVGAAVVATALEIAGIGAARVYAGSLIEYASLIKQQPGETGRACSTRSSDA